MLLGIEISQGSRLKFKAQVSLILMGVLIAANFSLFSAEE